MDAFLHVFADLRPIDIVMLTVEFLILTLLIGQQIARIRYKRRLSRRLSKLFYALAEGQELRTIAPELGNGDSSGFGKWKDAVQLWTNVTRKTLEGCSGNAVVSFMHDADVTVAHTNGTGRLDEYDTLVVRLHNLRCIMEHMDAYFPR